MQPDTLFKQLRTPQLVIRRLHPNDVDALVLYRNQTTVAAQGRWSLPFTDGDAQLLSRSQQGLHPDTSGQEFCGVLTLAADSTFIMGEWSLMTDHIDHRQVDLGLSFSQEFLTRTIVHQTIYALCSYLFDQLSKNKVRLTTASDHHLLNSLLDDFGMSREAHLVENAFYRGTWHDEYLHGMLGREWRTRYKSLHRSLIQASNPNNAV